MEEQSRWEKYLERLKTGLWGFGLVVSIVGARSLGVFHVLELMVLDRLFATQLPLDTTERPITIVEIGPNYADGNEDQGYTIDAPSFATILDTIFQNEPAVVGADVFSYLITGDLKNDLLPVIQQHPNLIMVESILGNPIEPLSELLFLSSPLLC